MKIAVSHNIDYSVIVYFGFKTLP